MKKKLLFVIPNLGAGGAEKSLINLLNELDYNLYDVDLLLFSKSGLFLNQLPTEVNLIELNSDFYIFQKFLPISIYKFFQKGKYNLAFYRLCFYLINRAIRNNAIAEQRSWIFVKKSIKPLDSKYHAAIAYLEKSSCYFIVDFVKSNKRIAYIHNDYNQLGLDFSFDNYYFQNIDNLVTVSEKCKKVLEQKISDRQINLIYNISSPNLLNKLANDSISIYYEGKLNILTIARLADQKGIDIAIKTAKILFDKNLDFVWNVIGEGTERKNLEKLIKDNNLENNFKLLGLKENPYPYLKNCNFYVQPSRYEGKSIAIDEALILKKLIVVTRFSTAEDQIKNNINGWIAEMNPNSLADKLLEIFSNRELQKKVINYLENDTFDFRKQLNQFNLLINE